jgi:hypothetical protein
MITSVVTWHHLFLHCCTVHDMLHSTLSIWLQCIQSLQESADRPTMVEHHGHQGYSGSRSSPSSFWRGFIGWRLNGMPASVPRQTIFNGLHLEPSPDWSNCNMSHPIPVYLGRDKRKPEITSVLVTFKFGTYHMKVRSGDQQALHTGKPNVIVKCSSLLLHIWDWRTSLCSFMVFVSPSKWQDSSPKVISQSLHHSSLHNMNDTQHH